MSDFRKMNSSYFALGYACNHNCIICPVSEKTGMRGSYTGYTEADINSYIESLRVNEVEHVVLSGGEPTLSPLFFPLLEKLADQKIRITLLSNGERFADKELVQKLKSVYPTELLSVTTAFHASYKELHEIISGKQGSFEATIEGCNNILSAGYSLTLKHCIHGMNYSDSEAFIHFINHFFPESCDLILCEIDYVGIDDINREKVRLSYKDLGSTIEKMLDVVECYQEQGCKRRVHLTETPLCIVDPYYWKYFSRGSTELVEVYAENNGGVTVSEQVMSECGTFFEVCKGCRVKDYCPGTWYSSADILGIDELRRI